MLLTEMTLLVRAYKEEVSIERAKVQAASSHLTSSSRPNSRPQSSQPASLSSSRSSRPQSRQRPHTASPMVRDTMSPGVVSDPVTRSEEEEDFGIRGDESLRRRMEWELERKEAEEHHINSLRQVAPAPVKVTTNRVQRMEQESIKKRQNIAHQLEQVSGGRRRRGDTHSNNHNDERPTTAPVQRQVPNKSSVLSKRKKKQKVTRESVKSASYATRRSTKHGMMVGMETTLSTPSRAVYNKSGGSIGGGMLNPPGGGPPNITPQDSHWAKPNQPYIPSALIRTSLRDGFVHSSKHVLGPDGISLPQPLIMSESAPQLSSVGRGRPKSSPFIRFGSSGIQGMLDRKRRIHKSRG